MDFQKTSLLACLSLIAMLLRYIFSKAPIIQLNSRSSAFLLVAFSLWVGWESPHISKLFLKYMMLCTTWNTWCTLPFLKVMKVLEWKPLYVIFNNLFHVILFSSDGSNNVRSSMFDRSKEKIWCSSSITKRWSSSGPFDVRKNDVWVCSMNDLVNVLKAFSCMGKV